MTRKNDPMALRCTYVIEHLVLPHFVTDWYCSRCLLTSTQCVSYHLYELMQARPSDVGEVCDACRTAQESGLRAVFRGCK